MGWDGNDIIGDRVEEGGGEKVEIDGNFTCRVVIWKERKSEGVQCSDRGRT